MLSNRRNDNPTVDDSGSICIEYCTNVLDSTTVRRVAHASGAEIKHVRQVREISGSYSVNEVEHRGVHPLERRSHYDVLQSNVLRRRVLIGIGADGRLAGHLDRLEDTRT